jgi:hypothetical protein
MSWFFSLYCHHKTVLLSEKDAHDGKGVDPYDNQNHREFKGDSPWRHMPSESGIPKVTKERIEGSFVFFHDHQRSEI